MKLLVNFATPPFLKAQQFNRQTAIHVGNFDEVFCAHLNLIDAQFKSNHQTILEQARGAGYWLWKPYILFKLCGELKPKNIIMYCDAGVVPRMSAEFYTKLAKDDFLETLATAPIFRAV